MKETKSMDSKYTKLIDDLRTETRRNISEARCSCPTTSPVNPVSTTSHKSTASSTSPTTPQDQLWPGGYYRLFAAMSGCPAFPSRLQPFPSPTLSQYILFAVHSGSIVFGVNQCVYDDALTSPSSSLTWPRGSYCIVGTKTGSCPSGFDKGYVKYCLNRSSTFINGINFCCRSDGSAHTPIVLPTGKPFYLLRYTGTCQNVRGMYVTQDLIKGRRTALGLYHKIQSLFVGAHPDVLSQLILSSAPIKPVRLCLYRKLH